MLRKMSAGLGSMALALVALTPVVAQAQRYDRSDYYARDDRGYDDDGYRDHRRAYRKAHRDGWNDEPRYDGYDRRAWSDQRRYADDRGGWDDSRGYERDDRGEYYRDARRYRDGNRGCQSGTTGTVIGAIAGGLLGRTIDRGGDRTLGTVLGAGAGALAGNAVERADNSPYCRR